MTTPPQYLPGSCFETLTPVNQQFVQFVDFSNNPVFQGLFAWLQIPHCDCPQELLRLNAYVTTFSDIVLGYGSVTLDLGGPVALLSEPAAVVERRSGGTQAITIQSISFDNTSILAGDVIGTKLRVKLNTANAPPNATATVSIQQVSASPGVQSVPVTAEKTESIPDTAETFDVTFNITAPSTSATGSVTYSATICASGNSQFLASPTATLLVQGAAPPSIAATPLELHIATGGVKPLRNVIFVSLFTGHWRKWLLIAEKQGSQAE